MQRLFLDYEKKRATAILADKCVKNLLYAIKVVLVRNVGATYASKLVAYAIKAVTYAFKLVTYASKLVTYVIKVFPLRNQVRNLRNQSICSTQSR